MRPDLRRRLAHSYLDKRRLLITARICTARADLLTFADRVAGAQSEPVRGGAERIPLSVSEYFRWPDPEDLGLARRVITGIPEGAVADRELPPAVPPGGERGGDVAEHDFVGDLDGVALQDNVHPSIPAAAAGGQHDVRIGTQVGELLLLGAGAEPDGAVVPDRDHGRDVRAAIGPDSGDPEQLRRLENPAC